MTERRIRLHCFAHAGAGVSGFRRWGQLLAPAGIDPVAHPLPGREGRAGEARVTDRAALLAAMLPLVAPAPGAPRDPVVFYGHSLGGLVAHALTRALRGVGLPGPDLLVLGACPPPGTPNSLTDARHASDEDLLRLLVDLDGVPADPALARFWRRMVLPVLRDDLRLGADLRDRALTDRADPLPDQPMLVLAGDRDPLVPAEAMAGWSAYTTGPVYTRTLPGDHFFVRDPELPTLLRRTARVLTRTRTPIPA
ncbi:thioesterase II family protein (plasmid) [Streptomyces sp. BI20]|uniref:thioesterase II family protein n=1 Tax=Streptomyces sp. BI20 TaxID=3403460 RepID=UPI003C767F10